MDERDCCTLLLYKGQRPGTAIGTGSLTWSGRQDSNLRPLDPQDVGVGVFAGQRGRWRRVCEQSTCGLFTSVQDVWSPNGPQPRSSVMGLRCVICDGRSDGTGRQEGCGVRSGRCSPGLFDGPSDGVEHRRGSTGIPWKDSVAIGHFGPACRDRR
jgi:hypothetical protein